MNFDTMVEYHWHYGYLMFWMLAIGSMCLVILFYYYSGLWSLAGISD